MSCIRELSITITEEEAEDMPLDAAVYEPGRDMIFGVRSGYVFQFNATTGALENSARYFAPAYGDAHITYESITDRLYVTHWFNYSNQSKFPVWQEKFMHRIIPDTLGVETFYQFDSSFFGVSGIFKEGPRQVFAAAGKIYGVFHEGSASTSNVYEFDPGTGLFNNAGSENTGDYARSDLAYDSVTDSFWIATIQGASRYDRATVAFVDSINLPANNIPRGLAYRNPDMYFAMSEFGTVLPQHIRKKRVDDTGPTTTIDMGSATMIPFNIRYRASTDRLYVPTTLDNTVVIIDPNTDTVESVKAGFDSPWDVVFTASKAFAVQHGPQGLKEIV